MSDHIYVLDFGVMLFNGTSHEVSTSQLVRDAYLGTTIEDAHVGTFAGIGEV